MERVINIACALSILFITISCTKYTYPGNSAAPADINTGLACDSTLKAFDIRLSKNAKFYTYEVTNTGTCPVHIKVYFNRGGRELSNELIPPGQHVVFIGDVPKHQITDLLYYTLHCGVDELGTCAFVFKHRICESTSDKNSPHPDFKIEEPGRQTVPLNPTGNGCITLEKDKIEILTITNRSGKAHEFVLTIESTGRCPEFKVEPINMSVPPNTTQQQSCTVLRNTQVKFSVFCGGNPVPDPLCSGIITATAIRPR